MNTRYDACSPRKGNDGKTRWQKVGVAFTGDKGTQIILDAYPIPDAEGRVVINLFEPKPREQTQRDSRLHPAQADDEVPW